MGDEDEWIDEVDELDRVVGMIRRHEAKVRRVGLRVVHVFLFNARGDLLLQRLPSSHPRFPEHWGSSVAGHVKAGESYFEAAARELSEELGVVAVPLDFLGTLPLEDEGVRKFVGVFRSHYDGPLRPDAAEIAEVRFRPPHEIRTLDRVTPTFSRVFAYVLARG